MISRFPVRAVFAAMCIAMAATAHAQRAQTASPPSASVAAAQPPGEPELTADLFYRLLLGDVALQRGDLVVSARAYLAAARSSDDVRLAERATEIAIASRARSLVHDAAELWTHLDPSADRPKRVLASLAANSDTGSIPSTAANDELRSRIERVLADAALSGPGVGDVFLQINQLFSQQSDKRAVLSLVRDVAKPYPKTPEAHYAVALAAYSVGEDDAAIAKEAREEIDRALELRPAWERAAILKAEIVAQESPDAAMKGLASFIEAHPAAKSAAGALAQQYVDHKRYADARALMQKLWDREPGVIDLYLAQADEETRQWSKAIGHYRAVTDGDRAWLAKLRIGALYGKQGNVAEGQRWLAGLNAVTKDEKVQLKQAEAQLLREAGDDAGAYRVLEKGLVDNPDTPDLIYDLAMVAEKLDKVDEAETKLKHLVELRPDDAQALNALGYTLVDRTPRTDEGLAFIERAHKIAPQDPFILDSLGWAFYRMGRLDQAQRYLQQALDGRPDAEIAAHLGEVLWRKGERDKAMSLWKAQLGSDPDNAVLKETVKRFAP